LQGNNEDAAGRIKKLPEQSGLPLLIAISTASLIPNEFVVAPREATDVYPLAK
jgi:hypothetical protein